MVSIYLIEDCDGLKYVGSTTMKLNDRLTNHRYAKNNSHYCSSSKLNLDNCIIIELEHCDLEQRKEREKYWINEIDCVNQFKLNFDQKEWHENNKDKKKEYDKEWYEKNKEKIKEYYEQNKEKILEQKKEYYQNNEEKIKEKKKEYRKLQWYCPHCDCNVKRCHKARHLKTKKHQLKINVCINKDDSKEICDKS